MHIRLGSAHLKIKAAVAALLLCASLGLAQQPAQAPPPQAQPQAGAAGAMLTVPSGTRILLALVRPVSTKSTKPGDPVYLQTTFPVTAGDKLLVPAGTFLEGTFGGFQRQKDRLQLQMQSAALIFSNGYKVDLLTVPDFTPGPGADIRTEGGHPTAAVAAAVGASLGGAGAGALVAGARGAVIGGAIGAPVGFVLAIILLNHGKSVHIEAGSPVEITLEHPLLLDEQRVAEAIQQPNRVLAVSPRPKATTPPSSPVPGPPVMGTCFTPDIPGTPPIVVSGGPDQPPTVIPGTPAIPGTPYPCPQ